MGPASAKGEREGGERRRELRRKQEKRKERLENPRECCELLPGKGGIDDQQRPSREGLSEKHDQRSLAPNSWVSDGEVTQGVRELTANCEDLWQSISLSLWLNVCPAAIQKESRTPRLVGMNHSSIPSS